MAFSYSAGTATPDYAGLAEWTNLRFGSTGSFRALLIPPITDSAPLRVGSSPSPEGGGVVADPKLDVWAFDLVGWLFTDDVADIQGGLDYLHAKINTWKAWETVTFNAPGWAEARRMRLRVAGQVTVAVPDKGQMKVPERVITVPLIAEDPRLYGVTEQTVAITTATAVTNDGNYGAPFTVRFNGPQTDPKIDKTGTSGTARIKYVGTIASGDYVDFDTLTGEAVDDTGASVYSGMSATTARWLDPGATSWDATNASGAGTTEIIFRDCWA